MKHLLIFTALFALWTAAAAQSMPVGNENDPGRHWTTDEVCPPTPKLHPASRHDFDRHDGGNDLATRRGLRGSDTDRDNLLRRHEQQDDCAQRVAPQTARETFTVDGINYRVNSDDNAVEVYYNSNINGDVSIPQSVYHNGKYYPVTAIGNEAFYGCSGLTSINIPNSVSSIGNAAFYYCSGLTSVTIGNSVSFIGNEAFYYCYRLTSINIPNSVSSIGEAAFYECSGLTSVTIGNSVSSIGNFAFDRCSALTSIKVDAGNAYYDSRNNCNAIIETKSNSLIKGCMNTIIPNSVSSIGDGAFAYCKGLTSINIPNSVSSIGNSAFLCCSGLTSVTIGNSVSSIGVKAFDSCSALTSIKVDAGNTYYDSRNNCNAIIETKSNSLITGCMNTIIPNSVSSIGNYAFGYCKGLTSINIPNSVSSIGDEAFEGCSGLTSVTIGNSVSSIGNFAFDRCSALTSINIPNSVSSIGYTAFAYCSGLTSVTIGNSVSSIGNFAFMYCSGLTEIHSLNPQPPALGSDVFDRVSKSIPLYVPSQSVSKYIAATGWKDFINVKNEPVPATSITLNKTEVSLASGATTTLTATILPDDATNKSVTWESSNNAIATVDSNGKVTGIASGTATITATTTDGTNLSASCQVTVSMTAKSISLNKTSITLNDGQTETLVATVAPDNTANKSVTWKSSNNAIASVDENGKVTGIAPGTATITATTTDGTNLSASCHVTVSMTAKSISLNKTSLTLNDGQTETLVVTVAPDNTTDKSVTWKSSNTAIASVDENGMVTAIAPGTATITATTADGTNLSASCQVTVSMTAKSISLNKTSITLNDGQTETLVATVAPDNTANKSVTWNSNNTTIASVDENGKVTGIAPGTATITATTADGTNLSASCQVMVSMTAKSISLNHTTLTLNDGQTETLVATVAPDNTANKNVTWNSNNTTIASVDENGKVTGIAPGTATITATTADGTNLSASCQVTVNMTAKSISLNKTSLTLNDGQTETLVATVAPDNTANKSVTWKSSNTAIASVDENGMVTAIAPGTATITATTTDGTNLSATCDVTVFTIKLYADTIDFFGGEDIVVAVKMRNPMEISGFQTDLQIPNAFTFVKDEDGYLDLSLSDRASRNHTIGATALSNTKYRILAYSNINKPFSGNDGDLFYFKVKTEWDTPIQTYTAGLTETEFTTPDGTRYDIDNSEIKFRCYYIPGDANHDKKVSIADIIAEARQILLQNPEHFHYKSANVNEDEKISVSDIALTANIILGRYNPDIKFSVQRMMGGDALSANVVESRGDGSRTIAIALDGNTDYTAFQADLCLHAGMEITGARLSDRAGRSHSVAMNRIDGNTVRVLAYASDNAVFAGNSGDLLLIDVKGRGEIEMKNALFAEPNGCEHELDEMTFSTELSGINDLTVGNAPVNVYNTAGQLIRTNVTPETATQGLPAGFYLVGNKKVVVK